MSKRGADNIPESSTSPPKTGQAGVPDTTIPMQVEITRIKAYDRNPRRSDNPEYDRIKASIHADGMDQPLVITCRPGETDYVVHAGGNTRLRILQELYEETGDEAFYRVHCLYRTWNHESDVLLAHLRENDLRGGLSFIDKAQAVLDAKQLLEAEMGIDSLSQRRLETILRDRGYSLSHGLISQMGYAVHTLLPVIPRALQSGLGRPQVERIRALDRAARGIWKKRNLGDNETFDAVLATLCGRYDGPEWDLEQLRSAIETEIAEEAEVNIHTIRVELDARLIGRDIDLSIPDSEDGTVTSGEEDTSSRATPVKVKDVAGIQTSGDHQRDSTAAIPDDETLVVQGTSHGIAPNASEEESEDLPDAPIKSHVRSIQSVETQSITLGQPGPTDLKSLRARAWTLAARLAQRNGIGELVTPLSGKGLGFILRDVPDSSLADQLDADTLGQVSMLWWHLAACAEMTVAPLEAVMSTLSAESILRQALENQDAGLLFNSVWTLDPGHTGYRLWRQLSAQDWQDLLNLMDTYRHIHRVAEDSQTQLWE
ncbi:MAG: ParB N-terminal domain-containing protein [Deltaproteobacteria bacterium]|nr:ParB N-terminal domain-containing protein [Deltaproteobacteria bacterium]